MAEKLIGYALVLIAALAALGAIDYFTESVLMLVTALRKYRERAGKD